MSDAGSNPNPNSSTGQGQHDQWIRKVSLIVADAAGNGLDLSKMRVHFQVSQSEFETPNNAVIRVFNLSTETEKQIRKEFTTVTLQAGYENGAFGIIFFGSIKQAKSGRDNQTDTYLDIFAADSDLVYNFGMIAKAIAAGTDPKDQATQIAQAMGAQVGRVNFDVGLKPNIRGKTLYGMGRAGLRNLARSGTSAWSFQNGKLQVTPLAGYLPGEAVVINSKSGMVGLPEQTQEGIKVRTLLNPKIQIGTQVQINESSIQRSSVTFDRNDLNQFTDSQGDALGPPPVTADGFYVVIVNEQEGDTRANEYYSNLICLSISKSAPPDNSVKVAG